MAETTISLRADALRALVDVLIPGDGQFPAASAVGAQGLLAERLRERLGLGGVDEVLAALGTATGGVSLAALDEAERVTAVQRFEQDAPALFGVVLNILYYSYYEHPLVVEAVRGLGIVYNDAPLPLGYQMAPFEPTPGIGVPAEPRGFYVKTEQVSRIPLPGAARTTANDQGDGTERVDDSVGRGG